ncbi:MAG TPA: ABC transporter permease [Gemmatimonadales bacterium]|nr:ABC transporter permease [Gemmatimonadales bacterium]
MARWLAGRLAQGVLTFAVATVLLFCLMRATPGDPLARLAGERQIDPADVAHLRARYGLDQPLGRQFATFVTGALRGDLGVSITYGRPVTALLRERLPATLLLVGTVLLVDFTLGLWLGVRQALARGRALDATLSTLSLAGYAAPSFWIGLVLAWLVGVEWRLLPAAGMADPLLAADAPWATRALDVARHLVLPALTLVVVSLAAAMRYQRAALLEVLAQPFMQTARAKGLPARAVVWRHGWRNALFPVLTLFGLWLPLLASGSVFVEAVFAWPGLGSLAAEAVAGRDYPVIMGTSLLVTVLVVASALLVDLAYAWLDPRVRHWT